LAGNMPIPPPPPAGLTSTGNPIARAAARVASWSAGSTPEPFDIGMPWLAASSRARVLCPIASIQRGDGPMKRTPTSTTF
jgi:hypothetical protein